MVLVALSSMPLPGGGRRMPPTAPVLRAWRVAACSAAAVWERVMTGTAGCVPVGGFCVCVCVSWGGGVYLSTHVHVCPRTHRGP